MNIVTLETMDVKLTVFIVLLALGLLIDFSSADFFYNRKTPKHDDLETLDLKCIPGRTVIKVEEKAEQNEQVDIDSDEFVKRRYSEADAEERCSICVCSTEGKDEYCSKRPAASVNECMVISAAMDKRETGEPFELEKNLAYRVRRVTGGKVEQETRRQSHLQKKCVPYVSQYTDCNEFNQCEGCTKCLCSAESVWDCRSVQICNEYDEVAIDDEMFEAALDKLEWDMKKLKKNQQNHAPSLNALFSNGMSNESKKSVNNYGYIVKTERQKEEQFKPALVNTRLVPAPPGPKGQEKVDEDLLGYVFAIPRQQRH